MLKKQGLTKHPFCTCLIERRSCNTGKQTGSTVLAVWWFVGGEILINTKARLEIQVFLGSNQYLVISSETSPPQHLVVITNTSLSFLSTIPEHIFWRLYLLVFTRSYLWKHNVTTCNTRDNSYRMSLKLAWNKDSSYPFLTKHVINLILNDSYLRAGHF